MSLNLTQFINYHLMANQIDPLKTKKLLYNKIRLSFSSFLIEIKKDNFVVFKYIIY